VTDLMCHSMHMCNKPFKRTKIRLVICSIFITGNKNLSRLGFDLTTIANDPRER
jgi:hypothetical protein